MTVEIRDTILVEVGKLFPNEWNPNVQSDATFNQLVDEIREDGFEQPLNVVPREDEGTYTIIGGFHRWKAAKVLGMPAVPCYVHDAWDEKAQKLKTVRRNLMTGELDDTKFTALVKSLEDSYEIDPAILPSLLGFESEKEFAKHYIEEKDASDRSFIDSLLAEAKKESHAVDAVVDVVSNIFSTSGETIDQNFIHFAYKGSVQTVIMCDEKCNKSVKSMVESLRSSGGTATDFISTAIDNELEAKNADPEAVRE